MTLCADASKSLPIVNEISMNQSFLPIYYDAWENDNVNDPFLSLIHTIISNENIDRNGLFQKNPGFLKKALALTDLIAGSGICDCWERAKGTDLLSEIDDALSCKSEIKAFLQNCIIEKADRLVIFIDELDRCRPDFAVKLLERIKHYFQEDCVTFVLSINAAQLIHTIKAFYGQDFDACRYLDRFFDFRVELPAVNIKCYMRRIDMGVDNEDIQIATALEFIKRNQLSFREIEKYCRALKASSGKRIDQGSLQSVALETKFFYAIIVPIALGLKMVDVELYRQFISGANVQPLMDIISEPQMHEYAIGLLEISPLADEQCIENIYNNIFSPDNIYRDTYDSIVGLLSDFSSYHE